MLAIEILPCLCSTWARCVQHPPLVSDFRGTNRAANAARLIAAPSAACGGGQTAVGFCCCVVSASRGLQH